MRDKALREHILYLLSAGSAHIEVETVIADIPVNIA